MSTTIDCDVYEQEKQEFFNIKNYLVDGFKKVCEVDANRSSPGVLWYKNINCDLMYSEHCSWVYFIVVNDIIHKVGETGNPLGIESTVEGDCVDLKTKVYIERQPTGNSTNRLGRLRKGCGTDSYIRTEISRELAAGSHVEIYAKKCPYVETEQSIGGENLIINTSMHKELERYYLYRFSANYHLPWFNKCSK